MKTITSSQCPTHEIIDVYFCRELIEDIDHRNISVNCNRFRSHVVDKASSDELVGIDYCLRSADDTLRRRQLYIWVMSASESPLLYV